jgi:hypothetical protein
MRKSYVNDEFLVLFEPIISRLFSCSNEEKNKQKQQRVLALVLSLWVLHSGVLLVLFKIIILTCTVKLLTVVIFVVL